MGLIITGGNNTAGNANVDSTNNLQVNLPYTAPNGDEIGGGNEAAGAVVFLSENDPGTMTGTRSVLAPETDSDFRLRVGIETQLDDETFNYTAQNTGKHTYVNTTMANTWNTGGLLTNSGSITTTTTGTTVATYAYFPIFGGGIISYCQFKGSFSAQPVANTIIDVGMFIRGAANPYAPTDGVYFRLSSAGLTGVINHNGTETTTSVLPFVYVSGEAHQFLITIQEDKVRFWIDDILYGEIETPVAQGQPCMAASQPFAMRHAIVGGAAGGVLQFTLRDYNISLGGVPFTRSLGEAGNATNGSYQGLSGGTMGSLASYANSANPTAAVATNTTSAVLTALGGQGWETDTLAVTTDGIIMSYQVPAGTVSIAGRRLRVSGVKISSYVQTSLTGGGYNAQFSLAFGHTSVSLATAEGVASKASRRIPLGSYTVASGATALVQLADIWLDLSSGPVYVNPGEFIAIVKKKVGTAPSAGVIAYLFTLIYSWE
jgi:hypothetical protein